MRIGREIDFAISGRLAPAGRPVQTAFSLTQYAMQSIFTAVSNRFLGNGLLLMRTEPVGLELTETVVTHALGGRERLCSPSTLWRNSLDGRVECLWDWSLVPRKDGSLRPSVRRLLGALPSSSADRRVSWRTGGRQNLLTSARSARCLRVPLIAASHRSARQYMSSHLCQIDVSQCSRVVDHRAQARVKAP